MKVASKPCKRLTNEDEQGLEYGAKLIGVKPNREDVEPDLHGIHPTQLAGLEGGNVGEDEHGGVEVLGDRAVARDGRPVVIQKRCIARVGQLYWPLLVPVQVHNSHQRRQRVQMASASEITRVQFVWEAASSVRVCRRSTNNVLAGWDAEELLGLADDNHLHPRYTAARAQTQRVRQESRVSSRGKLAAANKLSEQGSPSSLLACA